MNVKRYVLYHGNCPDGCGSAMAAWMKFGDEAEYVPVSYGKELPQMLIGSGTEVYILDFSYPTHVVKSLRSSHSRLVVLDHHHPAKNELGPLLVDNSQEPYIIRFDMEKSGAVLAWEYFHPDKPVPLFVLYLQDRDLWRFDLAQSREVSAAVGSYPFDYKVYAAWTEEDQETIEGLALEGVACLRLKRQQVDNMARHQRNALLNAQDGRVVFEPPVQDGSAAHFGEVGANLWRCPVANATVFFSEVGERMLEMNPSAPFSAYFSDRGDGRRQWGLRSKPDFDCSVVAKAFGGGGHKQAAGFVQDVKT